jgi:tRNA 2-thiocytidine biosynthesis protein TtcA
MIAEGDRIAVGLSGGKDSMLLMHTLDYLQKRAPVSFYLHAVVIDGGFEVFHADRIIGYCQEQGWPCECIRVDMRRLLAERDLEREPCAFCSRLRRGKLYGAAASLGCGSLALGQHLDDVCASFLLGLFRGKGLGTMGGNVPADGGRLRVIRPLLYLREAALRQASTLYSFPECGKCDYLELVDAHGDRAWLEAELLRLEVRFPRLQEAMLASLKHVKPGYLLDPRFLYPD